MKTFKEWMKHREMCGTFVVGPDPKVKPVDFQVWGDPSSTIIPKKTKKKKK
jgi:hypothetical protein